MFILLLDVDIISVVFDHLGLEVVISIRPGNGPLPENHGFKTINSFAEI